MPEQPKPKPQFKPLLEIEREICQRFSSVRRGSEFSQAEIALKLGLSRNQIANIEACRVPLKFWIGNRFCEYVNINQLWLATGRLPKAPYSVLDESFYSPKPDSNALFSLVCLGQLREVLEMRRRYSAAVKDRELAPDFLADSYQLLFKELLPILVFEIPEAARLDFVDFLISGTKRFIAERSVRANVENKVLTDIIVSGKHIDVKSPMANLRKRLNQATTQRGMKSELAKFMGVPLANVSQWLSGEREPGGETTLRLLRWVERAEANQTKNPGSAPTRPGQKTQFSNPRKYEKTKPSPKKG